MTKCMYEHIIFLEHHGHRVQIEEQYETRKEVEF